MWDALDALIALEKFGTVTEAATRCGSPSPR